MRQSPAALAAHIHTHTRGIEMLAPAQRYGIASALAVETLSNYVRRLNAATWLTEAEKAEAARFASVIAPMYAKRDGFIPRAVRDLCK